MPGALLARVDVANNKFEFIASKDFQNFKEDKSAREKKREKKENIIIKKTVCV